jgi:hypothetical protein
MALLFLTQSLSHELAPAGVYILENTTPPPGWGKIISQCQMGEKYENGKRKRENARQKGRKGKKGKRRKKKRK